MIKLKGFIYDVVGWFASIGVRKTNSNTVLIIRIDEIGDYVLWRKFLQPILQHPNYSNKEIYFCGNNSFKQLFNLEFANMFKQEFWIDKNLFKTNMLYRYTFLKQLYKLGIEVIINPTYSRAKRFDDSIVKAAKPMQAIAMHRNSENYFSYEENYDALLYTQLIATPQKPLFEFFRNQFFCEALLQTTAQYLPKNTLFKSEALPNINALELPQNYFVVFPGSRNASRIWSAENFVELSNFYFAKTNFTAIVCGSQADEVYCQAFISKYKNPCINLCGKTNLPQMLAVLQHAKFLFSVDTGSVHLAAAVGCAVIGIYNGGQFGRFAPYPKEIAPNFYPIYPQDILQELIDEKMVATKYQYVIAKNYNSVSSQQAINKLATVI